MLLVMPDELEVLREMRPMDRDVFNYLAERIDYKSGIVGRSRTISYGGIAFDLSERDVARRVKDTLVKLTPRDVRHAIQRLVDAGLLDRLSKKGIGGNLVLSRPHLVSLHKSAQNPVGRKLAWQLVQLINYIDNNINELDNINESSCQSIFNSVGITSIQHTTTTRAREEKQFSMALDWQPDKEIMEKILSMSGFLMTAVKREWVNEFVTYWFTQPEKFMSSQQWTVKLARLIVDYLSHPGLYEKRHGVGVSNTVTTPGLKNIALPDWARVPKDDNQLVPWMKYFGYGDPPVGMDYRQARLYVQRQVEIRLKEWKRGLS